MHKDNKMEVQTESVGRSKLTLSNKYFLVKASCEHIEKSLQITSSNDLFTLHPLDSHIGILYYVLSAT